MVGLFYVFVYGATLGVLFLVGSALLSVIDANRPLTPLLLVGVGGAFLIVLARVRQTHVSVYTESMVIVNPFRTCQVRFDEIDDIESHRAGPFGPYLNGSDPVVAVRSKSGKLIPIHATYENRHRDALIDLIRHKLQSID